VGYVVPYGGADEVASLVHQLDPVGPLLGHVPDVVADDPGLAVQLGQKGLRGRGGRRSGRLCERRRRRRSEEQSLKPNQRQSHDGGASIAAEEDQDGRVLLLASRELPAPGLPSNSYATRFSSDR